MDEIRASKRSMTDKKDKDLDENSEK